MTKIEILDFLKAHKEEFKEKYGLIDIGLFGSYAKETQTEESDVDIAITSKKKDFFMRDDLREYLEDHFKKSVDVGYLDSFRAYYKDQIEKEIIYV